MPFPGSCGPVTPPAGIEVTDDDALEALQSGPAQFQIFNFQTNRWVDAGIRLVYHHQRGVTVLTDYADDIIDTIEAAIRGKDVNGCAAKILERLRVAIAEDKS